MALLKEQTWGKDGQSNRGFNFIDDLTTIANLESLAKPTKPIDLAKYQHPAETDKDTRLENAAIRVTANALRQVENESSPKRFELIV